MVSKKKHAAIVIGASSGLGRSLTATLASKGVDLVIVARNKRDLSVIAKDLVIRYKVEVEVVVVDLSTLDIQKGVQFMHLCFGLFDYIDQVYITAGMVDDDDFGSGSINVIRQLIDVNYTGIAFIISPLCERLCDKVSNITIISSIAAIRPRSRNVAYASSKIALEYFVRGLQHFYSERPIRLQLYRMGYMDTAMSAGKKLLLPVAPPYSVADYIYKKRLNRFRLRYYPHFWAMVAVLLKLLPWSVYKKLKH